MYNNDPEAIAIIDPDDNVKKGHVVQGQPLQAEMFPVYGNNQPVQQPPQQIPQQNYGGMPPAYNNQGFQPTHNQPNYGAQPQGYPGANPGIGGGPGGLGGAPPNLYTGPSQQHMGMGQHGQYGMNPGMTPAMGGMVMTNMPPGGQPMGYQQGYYMAARKIFLEKKINK